ncbi:glycosyltransferase, partial [Candidatus Neomarinimicrobiota bacterium]
MNPELTIIICTFNRGHLLSETLPFLFQQNVSEDNYHVLIVDNNSTDNTSEIINGFKKRYDNLSVINEYNQGLAYARNTGMNVATTDWIVYLDDDAKIPKDFVKKAINNIHNHNH